MFSKKTEDPGTKKCIEIVKDKAKAKDGKLTYEEIENEEFEALVMLLKENYPIFSLTFSYKREIRKVHSWGYSSIEGFFYDVNVCISCLSKSNLAKLLDILLINSTVTHLELIWPGSENRTSNDLGFETIPTDLVSKLLITNHTLVDLKLSGGTSYEDTELEVIVNALLENKSLEKLALMNCDINYKRAMMLADMLLTNKTITDLNLEGNYISKCVLESIENRLKRNARLNNAARWFLLLSEYPDFSNKELEEK